MRHCVNSSQHVTNWLTKMVVINHCHAINSTRPCRRQLQF